MHTWYTVGSWSGWQQFRIVVTPETVVRWHRAGFRLYWKLICEVRRPVGIFQGLPLRPLKGPLFDFPRNMYSCLRQSVSRRRKRQDLVLDLASNLCAQELCNGTSARKPGIKT